VLVDEFLLGNELDYPPAEAHGAFWAQKILRRIIAEPERILMSLGRACSIVLKMLEIAK
jgi:hypothetical protein